MKRIVTVLLALMVFALSACQKTPEKPVVQGKSLDKMIKNATKEQDGDGVSDGTLFDKLGAQETYTNELTDAKGKVSIHVNAQVIVPDSEKVSVQRVERGTFSQETVDIIREHLVKGELFAGGDAYVPTKEELQQQILALEAMIAQGKTTDRTGKFGPEMVSGELDYLKKQLETAPDTHTKTPISGKLEVFDEGIYSAGERLLGLAQSEQGGYETFTVYNDDKSSVSLVLYTSEKNAFAANMGDFLSKDEIEASKASGFADEDDLKALAEIPDVKISQDEAKAKADELIAALGIDNLTCYSSKMAYGGSGDRSSDQSAYTNPRKCVWFLRYVRKVNEIPITYTAYDCMKIEEDLQAAPWSYEDMTFAVDDSGIVGFRWSSPYDVTDTVTDDSNILSFDEVTDVFSTMSLVVHAWDGLAQGSPTLQSAEFNVTEIRFGLTRVTEQNKRDSGLIVPVWDFIGTCTYHSEDNGQTKSYVDGPIPILTVNAIDGTIINRSLGY
ncbi:hypothetical protein FACS18947_5720 [Bacteroidia bacterium]|nr:hypothetical protein FACS18947_5720 [Bacteroidia bacterium]